MARKRVDKVTTVQPTPWYARKLVKLATALLLGAGTIGAAQTIPLRPTTNMTLEHAEIVRVLKVMCRAQAPTEGIRLECDR